MNHYRPADPGYMGFYDVDLFDCPAFRMFTAADCPRSDDILKLRRFEPQSMHLWCTLARTATAILDIGAQVGIYSLAAASLREDIYIHAFEPNPYAFSRLSVHRRINHFDNILEHPFALSNSNGIARFTWIRKPGNPISSGGSLCQFPENKELQVEEIPVKTRLLNELPISYGNRPLVKIDTEGGEVVVLKGASDLLASRPDIIIESFDQENCDKIMRLLPPGASFYKIFEDGGQEKRPHLVAADSKVPDYNQFITWRPWPILTPRWTRFRG